MAQRMVRDSLQPITDELSAYRSTESRTMCIGGISGNYIACQAPFVRHNGCAWSLVLLGSLAVVCFILVLPKVNTKKVI